MLEQYIRVPQSCFCCAMGIAVWNGRAMTYFVGAEKDILLIKWSPSNVAKAS